MKVLLFLKRFDLALQAVAAIGPFLIWGVFWGKQGYTLFEGVHPIHTFFTIGLVQLVSMIAFTSYQLGGVSGCTLSGWCILDVSLSSLRLVF